MSEVQPYRKPTSGEVRSGNKYKSMFFTWNAPDENNTFEWCKATSEQLKACITDYKFLYAYQWESEIGEDGRNHLQGVIFFTQRVQFMPFKHWLEEKIPDAKRIHLESVLSTDAALEYTEKDYKKYLNDPSHPVLFEFFRVELVKQRGDKRGRENASRAISECLAKYSSYREALLAEPDVIGRCTRAAIDYYTFKEPGTPRNNVEVLWFYGASGSGKTYTARRLLEYVAETMDSDKANYVQKYYTAAHNLQWWPGYEGQRAVLIDELRWESVKNTGFSYLLQLLGEGYIRVETKGGFVSFRGTWIIITAQDDPDTTFRHAEDNEGNRRQHENMGQLIRRLKRIIRFSGRYDSKLNSYTTVRTDETEQYRRQFNVLHQDANREELDTVQLCSEYFTQNPPENTGASENNG